MSTGGGGQNVCTPGVILVVVLAFNRKCIYRWNQFDTYTISMLFYWKDNFLIFNIIFLCVAASLHKARTLSVHLAVNCEHEIFTNSYGETIDKRELADILNVELAEEFFRSAGVIKRHHVGREEIALLTAICVYSGG